MDFGNIIYIVAVIAYFIYQMTKKKGEELPDSSGPQKTNPEKGVTFEDLLKEIREAQNPKRPDPAAPAPKPIPVHERRTSPKKKVIEPEDDEIEYYAGTFNATKKNPYQDYSERPSIPKASGIKMDYEALEAKQVNPYAQKLKDPKSVKEAIVLAEILNRKHF